MFAPTKTWRRWHHKLNQNQRRYAVTSALAATALPSLNMARGHRIEKLPEVPLVVNESIESTQKTRDAVKLLRSLKAYEDVEKCEASKKIRAGKVWMGSTIIMPTWELHIKFFVFSREIHSIKLGFGMLLNLCLLLSLVLIWLKKRKEHAQNEQVTAATRNNTAHQNNFKINFHE